MAREPIPSDLRQFLARFIHSVEQLENLLLLARDPTRSWSVAEVFRTIQSSRESVAGTLEKFAREGFLSADAQGGFRFNPASEELADAVRRLMAAYRERRVSVIELIYKKSGKEGLQDFSNAFLLKKPRP